MNTIQQIIMVAAGVAGTMLTRFLPFMVFHPGKPTPRYVLYLGKVLPASVFALLVVYCLRHLLPCIADIGAGRPFVLPADTIAQLAGVAFTIIVHAWRRNMMWSIVAGTFCYMVLLRIMASCF